jgi:hypothetical protein
VKPTIARMAAAVFSIVAVSLAGCGVGEPVGAATESSAPAPDPERTQDLVPLTTAQAARKAQRVALVVSRGSKVVEGAPGTPFTRTTFTVQDVLKGTLPDEFVLQVIGGRLGDTIVPSAVPDFRRSGRYILFLGPDNRVGPTIFPQAVLAVKHDGDADVVAPTPGGLHLRGPPRLDTVLSSLRRYLSTEGSP